MNRNSKSKAKIMLLLASFLYLSLFSQTKCLKNNLANNLESKADPDPCEKSTCKCERHSILIVSKFTCPNAELNKCFADAECKEQKNGLCGWTWTQQLIDCLNTAEYCKAYGTYKNICVPKGTTPLPASDPETENDCYKKAICEVKRCGKCGFTETPAFRDCIKLLYDG